MPVPIKTIVPLYSRDFYYIGMIWNVIAFVFSRQKKKYFSHVTELK